MRIDQLLSWKDGVATVGFTMDGVHPDPATPPTDDQIEEIKEQLRNSRLIGAPWFQRESTLQVRPHSDGQRPSQSLTECAVYVRTSLYRSTSAGTGRCSETPLPRLERSREIFRLARSLVHLVYRHAYQIAFHGCGCGCESPSASLDLGPRFFDLEPIGLLPQHQVQREGSPAIW